MKIQKIVCGYLEENCYVISNENNDALVIDPGDDGKKIEKYIKDKELVVRAILITHYHFDHIGALEYIKECTNAKVIDYSNKEMPRVHGFDFEIIKTPGHTDDSVSFFFRSEGVLFSGDFLFKESIGRYDFENSSFTDMQKSISWIREQDKEIRIYPGHGDNTTLKYELKHNEFLK